MMTSTQTVVLVALEIAAFALGYLVKTLRSEKY